MYIYLGLSNCLKQYIPTYGLLPKFGLKKTWLIVIWVYIYPYHLDIYRNSSELIDSEPLILADKGGGVKLS